MQLDNVNEERELDISRYIIQELDGWYFYDETGIDINKRGPYKDKNICILKFHKYYKDLTLEYKGG